jgi:hypothetical protein
MACEVWSRPASQVLQKPFFEALPEMRGQGLEAKLKRVLEAGEVYHGRNVAVRDGCFDFVYSPLRARDGRVEGIAVRAFDATLQAAMAREPSEAA